jgi:hypothetical protein
MLPRNWVAGIIKNPSASVAINPCYYKRAFLGFRAIENKMFLRTLTAIREYAPDVV